MNKIMKIYEDRFVEYCSETCADTKYEWAASEVFDLATYDGGLDELFVKKIVEVLKVILERRNFEYIKDESNYITYILVCQLLRKFNWIEWGSSIRGAWFDTYSPGCETRLILNERSVTYFRDYEDEEVIYPEVRCTKDNIKALIKFIET